MVQKLGRTKKIRNNRNIGAKDEILTVQEKQVAHICNKTQRSLDVIP